ncbi:hypothetical protein MXB_917, partial [Myxobolus squamalis]
MLCIQIIDCLARINRISKDIRLISKHTCGKPIAGTGKSQGQRPTAYTRFRFSRWI